MAKVKKVVASTDVALEDGIAMAKKILRDETILIRVSKARKAEIERRAKNAGVSVSSYLLTVEAILSNLGGATPRTQKKA